MAISFLLEFKLNKISPQKLSEIPIFTIRKRHCAGYMKVPPWPKQIQIQVAQDKPLNFHERPRQNFFFQYQYNIQYTSDKIKSKYQLGDYQLIQH